MTNKKLKKLEKIYEEVCREIVANPEKDLTNKFNKANNQLINAMYNNMVPLNVRHGVFETNSSSTHALVIMDTEYDKNLENKKTKVITGEYGWESKKYSSIEDKLSYLLTWAVGMGDTHFYLYLRDTFPNIEFNVLLLNAGLVDLAEIDASGNSYAYIDHISDLDVRAFRDSKELLKSFVFGSKNFIQTGNDNGDGVYAEDFPDAIYVFEKGN